MTEPVDRKKLISEIESAFDGVLYPGFKYKSLRQAEAWDDYKKVDQAQDHRGRWQDLPPEEFKACQWALPHLDAHGYAYYLPALMTAILNEKDVGELIPDSMCTSLATINKPAAHRSFQLSQLNELQLETIRTFLSFYTQVLAKKS